MDGAKSEPTGPATVATVNLHLRPLNPLSGGLFGGPALLSAIALLTINAL